MRLYLSYLKKSVLFSALLAIIIALNGCSFSDSSESISDSTSSIISSPSSISGKSKKYQNEIADYTVAYIKSSQSNAGYDTFFKGISDIAAKDGITNWDQNTSTYQGIGKGLKKLMLRVSLMTPIKRILPVAILIKWMTFKTVMIQKNSNIHC